VKLILLPGMDGTGSLFEKFAELLATTYEVEIVQYPTLDCRTYLELEKQVRAITPASDPFVIVAESFSSPVAVLCASSHPPSLKGLIICAGFVSSRVAGWRRFLYSHLSPVVFRSKPPEVVVRVFLTGSNAPPSLVTAVRSAISLVKPGVLADRVRAILTCDVRAELAMVDIPIMYLQAKQDHLLGPSCLEEMLRIKPLIVVQKIEGPHLLLQREPEKATEAVKVFIEDISR
jgi:pimeloyl-[acyl-carrier protein] methyl ester esterase